jgi:hypothetical protein
MTDQRLGTNRGKVWGNHPFNTGLARTRDLLARTRHDMTVTLPGSQPVNAEAPQEAVTQR